MTTLIVQQLSLSTAEDELNYFSGQPEAPHMPSPEAVLPPGNYRVMEGQLYRIVPEPAPLLLLPDEQ
jgi:hypothetical protein